MKEQEKQELRENACAYLIFSSASTRQIADRLDIPVEKALTLMKGLQKDGYVQGTYTFYHPHNQGTSWKLNKTKWLSRKIEQERLEP